MKSTGEISTFFTLASVVSKNSENRQGFLRNETAREIAWETTKYLTKQEVP